ncbi:MAG: hypothetical protein CME31_06870 [Gimesia sp.]|uniref:Uncharacterized protein n=1 Tax=Gimesia maris TaxID=122 RepID=A0A3D3R0H6_9PLAN|nr:hypothetical protein [Gimesia sp.]HCO21738.1 hypothetical protein [Gimesia maris]
MLECFNGLHSGLPFLLHQSNGVHSGVCKLIATTKNTKLHEKQNNGWARIDIRAERSEQETVRKSEESGSDWLCIAVLRIFLRDPFRAQI